jgi:hypothetical protein
MLALALGIGALGAVARPERAALAADAAEKEKWGEHMGDLPFIVGYEKGMKEVEFTGRPPMYFFTTTW